jgi:small redox-active disulfide protein 2
MQIKVLGMGCMRCDNLEKVTINALAELGVAAEVEHVKDMAKIAQYGVMSMPGLVINDNLKVSGRVPHKEEIKSWIKEELK